MCVHDFLAQLMSCELPGSPGVMLQPLQTSLSAVCEHVFTCTCVCLCESLRRVFARTSLWGVNWADYPVRSRTWAKLLLVWQQKVPQSHFNKLNVIR